MVWGTDISGLPASFLTKSIAHGHMEMKAQMHLWTGKCMHAYATHAHTALGGRQY